MLLGLPLMPKMGRGISTRGGGGVPFASDALFNLDGTIELSGTDYYFTDKSGNNRDFLITGKDFVNYVGGFPYKTEATMSAPVGDAALIAADINNFLYAGDGTPNQLNPQDFFRNINFEDRFYSKHNERVLNINDREVRPAVVTDITMWSEAHTGSRLTTVNNYFGITKDASAIWVEQDAVGGNGSEALPYATITTALTNAVAGDTIYVKSGLYAEVVDISAKNNIKIYAVGKATIRMIAFNSTGGYLEGFNIDGNGTSTQCVFYDNGSNEVHRSRIINAVSYAVYVRSLDGVSTNCYIYDSFIDDDMVLYFNSLYHVHFIGNYFTTQSQYIINAKGASGGDCIVRYNDIQNSLDYIRVSSNYYIEYNNYLNKTNQIINIFTDGVTGNVSIKNNIINTTTHLAGVEIGTSTTTRINWSIIGNYITLTGVGIDRNMLLAYNQPSITIKNNHINNENEVSNYDITIKNNSDVSVIDISGNHFEFNSTTSSAINIYEIDATGHAKISGNIYNNYIETKHNIHSILVWNQTAVNVYRNKIIGYGTATIGIVCKTDGLDCTGQYAAYNIIKNCATGIQAKGSPNLSILNNSIYHDKVTDSAVNGIDISPTPEGPYEADNCIVKNNISINLATVGVADKRCIYYDAIGLDADNNIFYSENNKISNIVDGSWLAWQTDGHDANGINQLPAFIDPSADNFRVQVGSPAIGAGETLAAAYDDGLDASTNWGDASTVPVVVTKQQGAAWDIGAYLS